MQRKEFIKICGLSCLSGALFSTFMQSCATQKMLIGTIMGENLIVPLSDFETGTGNQKQFARYVLVQNEQLQYPICIYRFNQNSYSALWMRCTHQGTELQVFGDKLQCPAHGSEFSNNGAVENGPADSPLRVFPVILENGYIKISLKKEE